MGGHLRRSPARPGFPRTRDPGGRRAEALPLRGIRGAGGVVRGQAAGAQLRARGRRGHAVVGDRRHGRGSGDGRRTQKRGHRTRRGCRSHRRRRCRTGYSVSAATPGPRRHHLRPRPAAQHNVEHRRRAVVPHLRRGLPGRSLRHPVRGCLAARPPPLPEPGRPRLRRPLDRQLLPFRTAAGHSGLHVPHPRPLPRAGRSGGGRAPLPHPLRPPRRDHVHRAAALPARADARFPHRRGPRGGGGRSPTGASWPLWPNR